MKGFRCDNCRDFKPTPPAPEGASLFDAWKDSKTRSSGLPDEWVGISDSGEGTFHFCSYACLTAFSEQKRTEKAASLDVRND